MVSAKYTRVEEVEFRMSRNGPLDAAREDLQAKAKEQVFQDLQITFSGLAADVAITRYRRQVQDCGVRKAHGFKKTRKRADIADQPLHLHFFAQVQPVVSLEDRLAVVGRPDDRQHALPQRKVQLELIAQFSGHVGMQVLLGRSSPQQIYPMARQLARGRARENELLPGLALDEQVNDLEELGELLDLVDDDLLLLPAPRGPSRKKCSRPGSRNRGYKCHYESRNGS